jgi:hypothetical protein
LLAFAVTSLLVGACTVTVDDDPDTDDIGDEDDDIGIDDQDSFDDDFSNDDFEPIDSLDDDSETETETETESDTTDEGGDSDAGSDPGETTGEDTATDDTSEPTDVTEEPDAGDTGTESPSETETDVATDTDTDTDTGECTLPEAAHPSCNACLAESCAEEFTACYCEPGCAEQLEAVTACFKMKHTPDNPSADPATDFSDCEAEVGGDMLSDNYYLVVSCAGTPYEPPADAGEDPYNRTEGDGTCTNACFDLFSF